MLHHLQHLGAAESKLPKLLYVMQQFEQVWGERAGAGRISWSVGHASSYGAEVMGLVGRVGGWASNYGAGVGSWGSWGKVFRVMLYLVQQLWCRSRQLGQLR